FNMEDFPESVFETSQSNPIWKDFDTGESDGKSHYDAQCNIPDNLRCYYLIKVAKRNDKINDYSDNESSLSSSTKPRSYCKPISSEK
ncbi:33011_t:CDS:2, partial [Racocetra persica]